jgi:pimeloyl-ACP methyl ester carboxylesterase
LTSGRAVVVRGIVRIARRLAIAALIVGLIIVAGSVSGNQPTRDAVAAAKRELAIELESRRVDVGEVTLHVVLAGPPDGAPVVLLHGYPEFWYAWYRQMGRLAQAGFRVIVPDQRGYNLSDKPAHVEDYYVTTLAGDIAALIEALGYQSAYVAAHDWGGGVAWQLVIRHPERVRKLVIFDTPHPQASRDMTSKEDKVDWFRTYFQIPWLPEWTGRLANWRLLTNALRDSSLPGAFPEEKMDLYRSAWDNDGAMTSMVNWYRAAFRLPWPNDGDMRVSVPTLVVVAPNDAFIAGDLTRASMKYLDHGRLLELKEGTHWILQEDPEGTSKILIDFFGS